MLFRERRPNMHTARSAWEQSWAEDMDKNYRTGVLARLTSLAAAAPPEAAALMASDRTLLQVHQETRLICKLQEDLAKEAAARFAEDDFEEKWRVLSNEKRREIILEGIYRTMRIPDMEERRKWCPDSTLKNLASANGAAYLRMLKALLPAELNTPITEPIQVPHPIMNRLLSLSPDDMKNPGTKTMIRLYSLSRTYCLTTIVWNILLAFHGKNENQLPIKPPRAKADDDGKFENDEYKNIAADVSKQHNKSRKGLSYACWTCGKSDAMLKDGVKLMACSKCRKIDRSVWYCSRECQVQDWKNGTPRPHKLICGKTLNVDVIERAEDSSDNQGNTSEPDSSYKRSPALLHQMSLLSKYPEVAYMIVRPYPDPDQGIAFGDPLMQKLFNTLRDRAFRGNVEAVTAMFSMLSKQGNSDGILCSDIQKQLEKEFGVSLNNASRQEAQTQIMTP